MRAPPGSLLTVAACLAAAIGIASCGSSGASGDPSTEPRIDLVVGDVLPLTGPTAGLGVSAQKAAQLAVEKVNDAIGEANVDHALEIVHADGRARGVRHAVHRLIGTGVSCIIGPRTRAGMAEIAALPAPQRRAAVISPYVPAAALPGAGSAAIVALPTAGARRTLSGGDSSDRDPAAAFAALYASTDPPIGPAHTSDARQFDAVVLCYLSAVATGAAEPRIAESIGPPSPTALSFSWQRLADAIVTLEQGQPIVYQGVSSRFGLTPPG
jgi:hypothetical protein